MSLQLKELKPNTKVECDLHNGVTHSGFVVSNDPKDETFELNTTNNHLKPKTITIDYYSIKKWFVFSFMFSLFYI